MPEDWIETTLFTLIAVTFFLAVLLGTAVGYVLIDWLF